MKIIDNFVKDRRLLNDMQDLSNKEFWHEGYSWWHNSSPTITLRHRLIDYMWLQGKFELPEPLIGFEHWTGIYDAEEKISYQDHVDHSHFEHIQADKKGSKKFALIHHYDKDEGLYNDTGEIVSPSIGCIYYPILKQKCKGGKLRIYDAEPGEQAYDAPFETVDPVPNRLIIFNPGILHAVEQVTKGSRFAIAINLWSKALSTTQMNEMRDAQ